MRTMCGYITHGKDLALTDIRVFRLLKSTWHACACCRCRNAYTKNKKQVAHDLICYVKFDVAKHEPLMSWNCGTKISKDVWLN